MSPPGPSAMLPVEPCPRRCRWRPLLLVSASLLGVASAPAAEPEIVGAAALLLEAEVADRLGLGRDQRDRLDELIDERELQGVDQALAVEKLPRDERLKRLAAHRRETVRLAAGLLTAKQKAQFDRIVAEQSDAAYRPTRPAGGSPPDEAPREEATADKAPPRRPAAKTNPADARPEATPPGAPTGLRSSVDESSAGDKPSATGAPLVGREPVEGRLRFNFRYQPWKDVLDWFADQADLSLLVESPPPGTLNYRDDRDYSVAEALDVLNSVLLTKGFTLVRRGRMLVLVNLEDGVPPNLVTDVPAAELGDRGEYELVRVLFKVHGLPADDVAEELRSLVGPQGRVDVLGRAGMIQVTETAGRVRAMQSVIESIESPNAGREVREFRFRHTTVDAALPVLRQMLGIPEDALATPSGSLTMGVDTAGRKLLVSGAPAQVERLRELVRLVDVPAGGGLADTPQLEVYGTGQADPEVVLGVLQSLLTGDDRTRLAADLRAGSIVALATPAQHATIRATLVQMQQDTRRVEVIPLTAVDPRTAVAAVTRLFADPAADPEAPDPRAPIVDADLATNSLLVRASEAQLGQIRSLLEKLGGSAEAAGGDDRSVRMLPFSGAAADAALDQVRTLWPSLRPNRLRVVTPSRGIRTFRPGSGGPTDPPADDAAWLQPWPATPPPPPARPRTTNPSDRSTSAPPTSARRSVTSFAVQRQGPAPPSGADIVIAPGPGGLIIASSDTEALDQFEQLMRSVAGSASGGRELAVFYLRFAEAAAAAETLGKVFGSSGGEGGSLAGGIAEAALGDLGGGLVGDLLGLGGGEESAGGGFVSTAVDIVPDARLNALIVYAQPDDLMTIEQLLRVLDQRTGPEVVEAGGRPRLIPVVNSSATAVAAVVREVYKSRIEGASGGGGRQPSPEELFRALRGRGRGGGGGGDAPEPSKMTLGVDERSNSLVVKAPDPLFEEVRLLVKQLDEEGLETPQETRVVSLKHSNALAVKDALESLLGDQAVSTVTPANGGRASSAGGGGGRGSASSTEQPGLRRQLEFLRRVQESQAGGGPRGRNGGRGRRGGDGGGAPGRGGGQRGR